MAVDQVVPIAAAGRADSIDISDCEVELSDGEVDARDDRDEEMFDAPEGSEDETYDVGDANRHDSDDDEDFAEANAAFGTPAGSHMGDDEDHAIDDMHRSASEAIQAEAEFRLQSLGGGGLPLPPVVTPAASAATNAPAARDAVMGPDAALSSLNFIMTGSALPDVDLLEGFTHNNIVDELTRRAKGRVHHVNEDTINSIANGLRPLLPRNSARHADDNSGETIETIETITTESAEYGTTEPARSTRMSRAHAVSGNGSEEAVSHAKRMDSNAGVEDLFSSVTEVSSYYESCASRIDRQLSSSAEKSSEAVSKVTRHIGDSSVGGAKSAADAAFSSSSTNTGATASSSDTHVLLKAGSSINDSDSDHASQQRLSEDRDSSDLDSEISTIEPIEAPLTGPAVQVTEVVEVTEENVSDSSSINPTVSSGVRQEMQPSSSASEHSAHTAGGNGSSGPSALPPAPAPQLQQHKSEQHSEGAELQAPVAKEVPAAEDKPKVETKTQAAVQQQARGPSLLSRSGPSLPSRANPSLQSQGQPTLPSRQFAGTAAPSLPPRPSRPAASAAAQESAAAKPAAASVPQAEAPRQPPTVSTATPAAVMRTGASGPSLPVRTQRSGPTLPARRVAGGASASGMTGVTRIDAPKAAVATAPDSAAAAPDGAMPPTAAAAAAAAVAGGVATGAAAGTSPGPAASAVPGQPSRQIVSAAPQAVQSTAAQPATGSAAEAEETEEHQELRRRVQALRVMLLRITSRLGVSTQTSVVQQVIMRLDMAERIKLSRRPLTRGLSPIAAAQAEATALESGEGSNAELPFSCTVMLMGLSGGGKSSIINSLLDQKACAVSPFEAATKKVEVVEGSVKGINMRFIDTPGLQLGSSSLRHNDNILAQIKKATKKMKPDVVMWVDRMDVLRRPGTDLGVLQQVTATFGNSIWFNTVMVMTHAAKMPPEGSAGEIQYAAYINYRMTSLQQSVKAAAKDYRLMNPMALAENHPTCRRDDAGEPILPNGVPWRQQLLMLGLSSKLLVDCEQALDVKKGLGSGAGNNSIAAQMSRYRPQKLPPIPYLLSQMIQPRRPFKFPEEERGILSTSQINKIGSADERKDEFRKRRIFLQQQDQLRRETEEGKVKGPVAIPADELPLQPTFDPELGYNRYFYMPSGNGWVAQPHVEDNGVEHDDGVEGITIQLEDVVRAPKRHLGGAPGHFHAQLHADKTTTSAISEVSASVHHSKRVVSTGGIDFQTVANDHLWVVRAETRVKGLPGGSRIATGLTASRLVDGGGFPTKGPVVYGVKLEDRIRIRRNMKAVVSGGVMTARTRAGKEVGFAGNAKLSSSHGLDDSTVVLVETSLMKFRNDLMIGGNASVQTNPTPQTQVSGRINLNTKGTGGITLRVTSHDKKELAYSFAAPVIGLVITKIRNRGIER